LNRHHLVRYAWLSIATAGIVIGLKGVAWLLTGSVSLLSDALESCVNMVAAVVALFALRYAAQPPDQDHTWGHDKVEYFSSGIEGLLVIGAAVGILLVSLERLINPQPVEQIGLGMGIALIGSLLNFSTSRVLLNASRRFRSIALEADARHLMADVYTSAGILVGVLLFGLTGWAWLDPLIGCLVAVQITLTGIQITRRSTSGLLDAALPVEDQATIDRILQPYRMGGIQTHALRTRQSGARRFISMHVLVPPWWTVSRGHAVAEQIEGEIRAALPNSNVLTHLEPLNEAASFADIELDRDEVQQERPV